MLLLTGTKTTTREEVMIMTIHVMIFCIFNRFSIVHHITFSSTLSTRLTFISPIGVDPFVYSWHREPIISMFGNLPTYLELTANKVGWKQNSINQCQKTTPKQAPTQKCRFCNYEIYAPNLEAWNPTGGEVMLTEGSNASAIG